MANLYRTDVINGHCHYYMKDAELTLYADGHQHRIVWSDGHASIIEWEDGHSHAADFLDRTDLPRVPFDH